MSVTVLTIVILLVCGAAGGFANVFIGDSGLHLPRTENGVWQPGFIGTVFIGIAAALGSWAMLKGAVILGPSAQAMSLSTGDMANALVVGFGGAKWWKSETEKDVLQKAAAIAATKTPDVNAATAIATNSPLQALAAAMAMK